MFGSEWKSILWTDVTAIRVLSLREFPSGGKRLTYYIDQKDPPRPYFLSRGSIYFNQNIKDFQTLKMRINEAISAHGITVRFLNVPEHAATGI
jgi:hypothetical protein